MALPYLVHTARGYEVTGPDKDNEIELQHEDNPPLFLSIDDLKMMLSRIEEGATK